MSLVSSLTEAFSETSHRLPRLRGGGASSHPSPAPTAGLPRPRNRFPRAWNLRPAGYGYIGIEIGSQTIQIAQQIRGSGRSQPSAQWQLSWAGDQNDPDLQGARDLQGLDAALDQLLTQWPRLRSMFRGNRVALTLPPHLLPLRQFEIPAGSPTEMRAMVRDELSDELGFGKPFTFAFWNCKPATGDLAEVTVVAADYEISQRVTERLLECGLECRVLACLPTVLARAVQRASRRASDTFRRASDTLSAEPAAVLHIDDHAAQIVFCQQGRPGFCRSLGDCGLAPLHRLLSQHLQLTAEESQLLLGEVGLGPEPTSPRGRSLLTGLVAPALERLLEEIQRTLGYASAQYPDQFPKRLWITGGGAEVRSLDRFLAPQLSLDVCAAGHSGVPTPEPATQPSAGHPALFAAARQLSDSFWEPL